jgi:hypothetical protein
MSEEKTSVPIEKYREVLAISDMKDAEIKQLKESLKDAEFLLARVQSEKASIDQAVRAEEIDQIVLLTKGKTTKESLKDASMETIATTLKSVRDMAPTSVVYLMRQAEADAAKPPALGANGTGTLNQQTGKWEGGAPE